MASRTTTGPPAKPAAAKLAEADAVIKSWKKFSGVYKAKRHIFHTKWTGMSGARRVGIVKKHWLPLLMPSRRRPDLDKAALWRAPGVQKLAKPYPFHQPVMEDLLWPFFNQETLTSPEQALVQLMETRSNIHPRSFSRLDLMNPVNKKLQVHFKLDIALPQWSQDARLADIDLQGDSKDPDSSYGDLVPVLDAMSMHALLAIESFSEQEGIRVMKVQKKIYDFLGHVFEEVVQAEVTSRGTAPRPSASGVAKSSNETTELASTVILKPTLDFEPSDPTRRRELQNYLMLHHDLDPYSHPAEVDWECLGVLAHNQLRISENRLRSFKEDPEMFLAYIQQVRDHSLSMLTFYPGNEKDSLVEKRIDLEHTERCAQHLRTAFSTLTDAVDTWQAIFTLVEQLRGMRNDYDGSHLDLLEDSDEYAANILGIIRIGNHYKSNSVDLLRAIRCSENMRDYFVISEDTGAVRTNGNTKPKNNAARDLFALASTLNHDSTRNIFTEWTLFEEIYTLLQANDRLADPYLMSIAEDLNSLSSVMMVLERVWHSTHRYDLDINSLDLVRGALDYTTPLQRLRALDPFATNGVLQNLVHGHLKRPLRDNYYYKKQGRMARRDYDANETAVTNLAGFWAAAEPMLGGASALSETVRELLHSAQPLTVTRPDRSDRAATAKTSSTSSSSAAAAQGTTPSNISSSAFTAGGDDHHQPGRITFEERRSKEKTRPAVTLTLVEPPAPAALPAPADYPPIQLPPQHYNTVQMLMGPSTEARSGTISWAAVVGCLAAMGFGYRTGQGSGRVFHPSDALMATQVSAICSTCLFFNLLTCSRLAVYGMADYVYG